MKKKKKRKISREDKFIRRVVSFGLLCTLVLGVFYFLSVTYIRSQNIEISVKSQIIEVKNAKLKNKISELEQEIDAIKKEKAATASQIQGFQNNDDNIVIFSED